MGCTSPPQSHILEMIPLKKLRAYLKQNPHLWYILFVPAFLVCFFSLEALVGPEDVRWWVYSRLDDYIPFAEVFIVPYCLWYPLLFGTGLLLLICDVPNFKKYMLFLILGFGFALAFCLILPNGQALRPDSFERQNIFTRFVALMYSADTCTNVFPSMHVIGSVAAAVAVCKSRRLRRLRPLWIILAAAISVSTVFIKQHSVLDIFGALALCVPLYALLYLKREENHQ